jgi:hypothetical protein
MSDSPATSALQISDFPPAVQRSLDPKSPVPMRMMAAKGILACTPRDILSALFFLTSDPDPKVVETAHGTAAGIPEKLLSGLRDEEIDPAVLAFYAQTLRNSESALQIIALNPSTPDSAMEEMARTAGDPIVEIISQNQLRILRNEQIVRGIVANPNTRLATRDALLDFCVRSGLHMPDLPAFMEARRRVLGEAPPEVAQEIQQAEQHTAQAVAAELGAGVTNEGAVLTEEQRQTFTQRVMKMSVAQKIKLATLGNKEARTMLLRDSNKLVALAAVQSPRITDGEILSLSNSRTLHDDVIRYIIRNRDWLKNYQVKVNLVNNPKTPLPTALKLLQFLHPSEVKIVARNKNIAQVLQNQARAVLSKPRSG